MANKFAWPTALKREGKSHNTILDGSGHRSGGRCDENGGGGGVCAAWKLLPPLLNYYLASLYQVHRGRNATVVR